MTCSTSAALKSRHCAFSDILTSEGLEVKAELRLFAHGMLDGVGVKSLEIWVDSVGVNRIPAPWDFSVFAVATRISFLLFLLSSTCRKHRPQTVSQMRIQFNTSFVRPFWQALKSDSFMDKSFLLLFCMVRITIRLTCSVTF